MTKRRYHPADYLRRQILFALGEGHRLQPDDLAEYLMLEDRALPPVISAHVAESLGKSGTGGRRRKRTRGAALSLEPRKAGAPRGPRPLSLDEIRLRSVAVRVYRAELVERNAAGEKGASDAAFERTAELLNRTPKQVRLWVTATQKRARTPPKSGI